jgi:hypothetical protein
VANSVCKKVPADAAQPPGLGRLGSSAPFVLRNSIRLRSCIRLNDHFAKHVPRLSRKHFTDCAVKYRTLERAIKASGKIGGRHVDELRELPSLSSQPIRIGQAIGRRFIVSKRPCASRTKPLMQKTGCRMHSWRNGCSATLDYPQSAALLDRELGRNSAFARKHGFTSTSLHPRSPTCLRDGEGE